MHAIAAALFCVDALVAVSFWLQKKRRNHEAGAQTEETRFAVVTEETRQRNLRPACKQEDVLILV
jgi:hypothetical protein